jgi:hypothetical protein
MYNFKTQAEFEQWKSHIPEKVNNLKQRLSGKIDFADDYLSVCNALNLWLLENYQSIADIESDTETWDALSCLIGELLIKEIDSEWSIELDPLNTSDVNFGLPIVSKAFSGYCPAYTITTLIHRKRTDFLAESITKRKKFYESRYLADR